MARLLHLAPARLRRRIERAGLRGRPWTLPVETEAREERLEETIFATPVLRDDQITYQWVRELRAWANGAPLVGVVFEVERDTELLYGRFGKAKEIGNHHQAYTAIEADPWGAEVVVQGPIRPAQILELRSIRQDIGWQGTPDGSGHENCACPACIPSGHPKLMRRVRAQFQRGLDRIHRAAGDPDELLAALSGMDSAIERGQGRLEPGRLTSLAQHPDARVRRAVAWELAHFKWSTVQAALTSLIRDKDRSVSTSALEAMERTASAGQVRALCGEDPVLLVELCDVLEWSSDKGADAVLEQLGRHGDPGVRTAAAAAYDARQE